MDVDVQDIIIAKHEANGFLLFAVNLFFFQTGKLADTVVDVHDKITGLQRLQFTKGQGLALREFFFSARTMKAFENLMIGVAGHFE